MYRGEHLVSSREGSLDAAEIAKGIYVREEYEDRCGQLRHVELHKVDIVCQNDRSSLGFVVEYCQTGPDLNASPKTKGGIWGAFPTSRLETRTNMIMDRNHGERYVGN